MQQMHCLRGELQLIDSGSCLSGGLIAPCIKGSCLSGGLIAPCIKGSAIWINAWT